jgi:hypothetical protein
MVTKWNYLSASHGRNLSYDQFLADSFLSEWIGYLWGRPDLLVRP